MYHSKSKGKSMGKSAEPTKVKHGGGSHSAKVKVMTKAHAATAKRHANKKDTSIM